MTPNVLNAYRAEKFIIDMGNPERLYSVLISENEKRTLSCSGGCTVSDTFVFSMIQKVFQPEGVFVIGNSFGLSTFILADIFAKSKIDVIDAELEGLDVPIGSALTKKLADKYFTNVTLTVGFSPKDLKKAMTRSKYNFFFVDGLHTNEQILKDFDGILPFCDSECLIYFHDVACCNMLESWALIKQKSKEQGFDSFDLGFTQMGCAVLVRGNTKLKEYFENCSNSFVGPYRIGFKVSDIETTLQRPWFWDLSFGHLERVVRRKARRIFSKSMG